jgi:chromosome segregation ATPase
LTDAKREAEEKRKQEAEDAADRRKRAKENAEAEAERKKQEEEKNLTEEERRLKEAQDLRDRANEERIKKQDEYDQLQRELIKDDQEKEIAELVFAYEQKFAAASENAELEKELEEALKADIAAIQDKYRIEKEAKDKEAAEKELETQRALFEQKKELQNQDIDMALNAIGVLKDVFDDNKKFQKAAMIAESALGIAKIIVNTQVANAAALATPQAIASSGISAIPVIARNNIAAGIGIAANIASTAKALQSLGGGSAPSGQNSPAGGGGGGGAAGASPTPANFNIVGNAGANPLAGLNEPIKAYVVGAEVTTQQALDNQKVTYATFG